VCGWVWAAVLVRADSVKTLNWAALITALVSSIASVHFKISADGFEVELKRAQAQLDETFELASQCLNDLTLE